MSARPGLDPVIHQQARLGIMGMLQPAEKVDFSMLRDELGLTDSNLSQHLSTLEQAGYVALEKRFIGKKPRTWVKLTPAGRRALLDYIRTFNALVGRGR